jgi:hypothetical protein
LLTGGLLAVGVGIEEETVVGVEPEIRADRELLKTYLIRWPSKLYKKLASTSGVIGPKAWRIFVNSHRWTW